MPKTTSEIAGQRLRNFERNCNDEKILHLACHAALPVALNSELLHLLRINFFIDNPADRLPFTAETTLLFSPLTEEIDEDLYEIQPEIRDLLLKRLAEDYKPKRIREIATLLWQYSMNKFPWENRVGLERAQQLTALHYLNPKAAKKWLDDAEKTSLKTGTQGREWFIAMRKEIERIDAPAPGKNIGEPSRRVYYLRSQPLEVSEDDFKKVFGLNDEWKPLEYVKNDYEDNGDGTITDHATGLMWQQSGSDYFISYEEAKKYVSELNRSQFAGYDDWRFPTTEELMSLLEPEKQPNDLYISTLFDKKQFWCWNSDRRLSGGAWLVYFGLGYVYWDDCNLGYVRVVRS